MSMEIPKNTYQSDDVHSLDLDLELSLRPSSVENTPLQESEPLPPPHPHPLPRQQPQQSKIPHPSTSSHNNSQSLKRRRKRRTSTNSTQESPSTHPSSSDQQPVSRRPRTKRNETKIEPPYPWSTADRAMVHNLNYLQQNKILTITGDVKCSRCNKQYKIKYDLIEKFNEITSFIEKKKHTMHQRAPKSWMSPNLPNCKLCDEKSSLRPVIAPEDDDNDHKNINWLFLLLGQMIGCLGLKHLRYFCAYANIHRTAAKDRLLYLTYFSLCKQLEPTSELFDP